jgi:hypothetical protein
VGRKFETVHVDRPKKIRQNLSVLDHVLIGSKLPFPDHSGWNDPNCLAQIYSLDGSYRRNKGTDICYIGNSRSSLLPDGCFFAFAPVVPARFCVDFASCIAGKFPG